MIRNWQNESLYLMVWISCYLVHSKSLYLAWLPQSDFSHCGLFFFFLILFLNFTILCWFCQISKWIRHRYTCGLLLKNSWKLTVSGWRRCRGGGENLNFNHIFISCTPLGTLLNILKSTSIKWVNKEPCGDVRVNKIMLENCLTLKEG